MSSNVMLEEWRRGWPIVMAASLGIAFGYVAFISTSGMFAIAMQKDSGWARGAVTMGPLMTLASTFLNPVAGLLSDRYGARLIGLLGLAGLSVGIVGIAFAPFQPILFYAAFGFASIASVFGGHVVFAKGVATWFGGGLGLALGVTMGASSILFAILNPLLADVIATYGWRTGYLTLAGCTVFVGLLVVAIAFRQRPAIVQITAAAPIYDGLMLRDSLRDLRFWLLFTAIAFASMPSGMFLTQLQPILVEQGHPLVAAATFISLYSLAVAGGRIAVGYGLDRFNAKLVAAGCLTLSALGTLLLAWHFDWAAMPSLLVGSAVILVGLSQGAELNFVGFFAARIFGLRAYGALFGVLASAMGGGMTIGGYGLAVYFDRFGEYRTPMIFGALSFAIAACLISFLNSAQRSMIKQGG